jgi:hypothetical protein
MEGCSMDGEKLKMIIFKIKFNRFKRISVDFFEKKIRVYCVGLLVLLLEIVSGNLQM